ncbi:glycoside hydrolase family 3 protein [Blastococcus sp. SYSU D00820]
MGTVERLVDACLMPGFAGARLPRWVGQALEEGMAGVCLYGANLVPVDGPPETGAARVRALAGAVHAVAPDALVALDEEGGDVTRLEYLVGSSYPGNLALGVVDDEALTTAVAAAIGADLRRAGVDVDLAPSVDVNSDPRNPVIGVRSFGADPDLVARHGAAYVRGLQAAGVAACAKHFPGHGATTVDSHLGLPVVDADAGTVRRRELPPFGAAVRAGAELVMTSHVVFPAFDDVPATLSRRLLGDVLRGELGFSGVVVTDALDMAGVRAAHGIAGAGALSLAAGADLLLLGAEDGEEHRAALHREVARALRAGELTEQRLAEAAGRVAVLRARRRDARTAADLPVADGVGLTAARAALRLREVSPLTAPAVVVELRAPANMAVGDAPWSVAGPLRDRGLLRGSVSGAAGELPVPEVLGRAAGAPLVVAVRDAYRDPDQVAWLRELTAGRPDAVLAALGMPDDTDLTTGPAIAAHGAARVSTQAVAEALSGR